MEVRGAVFSVAKAMFCPRMLSTMTVMGEWVAGSIAIRDSVNTRKADTIQAVCIVLVRVVT